MNSATKNKRPSAEDAESVFRRVLNFTDADLKANRAGRMSQRQMRGYRFYTLLFIALMAFLGAVFGMVGVGNITGLFPLKLTLESTLMALFIGVIFARGGVLMAYAAAHSFRQMRDEIETGEVDTISGEARRSPHDKHFWRREIVIAGETFTVDLDIYEVLKTGVEYHLYVVRGTRTILAMETGVN